jgi:hypothetical protein
MSNEVNPIPPVVVNIALIMLTSLLGLLTKFLLNLRSAARAREARMVELETKLAVVSASVVPISTAFQAILIKELTHHVTPEMDALLVKLGPPSTLTPEEHDRLSIMLVERTNDYGSEISPSERDAAYILPVVMKRAQEEQEALREDAK